MWSDLSLLLNQLLEWAHDIWDFMLNNPLLSVVIALFVVRLVFDIFVYLKKKFTL